MHGEEFIADNMIKVGFHLPGDQLIVRDIAKKKIKFFCFFFFDEISL